MCSTERRRYISSHCIRKLLQPIFWNTETGQRHYLSGHTEAVTSVALSPDGRTALSGSVDQRLILWNTEVGEFIRHFAGHNGPVRSVALSADGRKALSGSDDCSVILWNTETSQIERRFEGHKERVSVAERSFSLLDRVQMLIKPMAQPLLRNGR